MKLRTEMQDGCVHANGYCVDEDAVELRQAEMLVHDAAAAHALVLAMDKMAWPAHRETLIERSDELLSSWGFDSGEVDSE